MKIEITLAVADACATLAFIDELHPDRVGEIPSGLIVIADAVDAAVRELDAPMQAPVRRPTVMPRRPL